MIRIIVILTILSLSFSSVFAQAQRVGTQATTISTRPGTFTNVGVTSIAKGRANIAEFGATDAPFRNPAALYSDNTVFYAEFGKRLPATWLAGLEWDNQFILPVMVMMAKPLASGSIAVGYHSRSSTRIATDLALTNVEQPDGTGEVFSVEMKQDIHTFFVAGSRPIGEQFCIGLNLGLNYLQQTDRLFNTSANGSAVGLAATLGTLWAISEDLTIASTLHFATDMDYEMRMEGAELFTPEDTVLVGNTEIVFAELQPDALTYQASLPIRFEVGLQQRLIGNYSLHIKAALDGWSGVSPDYRDRLQFHVGLGSTVSEQNPFAFGAGIFTATSPYRNSIQNISQVFLTAGIELWMSSRYSFAMSVLDSHLFENEADFYQTQIQAGLLFRI